MATYDPEFYDAPKFSADSYDPPARQRGCLFYGCVIASVMAVLMVIALAVFAFFAYRYINQAFQEYTATAPVELPALEMPEEQRRSVRERFDAFREGLQSDGPLESLVLDSDDLNALIEESPELKGVIRVRIEGDKLKALVSFPLERMGLEFLKGRYLNGEAELKASLSDGVLIVTVDSVEVKGKRPPDNLMQDLRQQNLAKDVYKNPKHAELIRRLESLEIKDGKIIIKPRERRAPRDAAREDASRAEPPPATKSSLPGGAPGGTKPLPADPRPLAPAGEPREKPAPTSGGSPVKS